MDMKYVDMVMDVIKSKGYTITKNPCKVKLKKEFEEQIFIGNYIEVEHKTRFGMKCHKIFVNDTNDIANFHNGSSVLGGNDLPSVIWFKEPYDKITSLEGLYI
jgi:hypothetical protein